MRLTPPSDRKMITKKLGLIRSLAPKSLRVRLLLLVFISIIPVLIFLIYNTSELERQREIEIKSDTLHWAKFASNSIAELTEGSHQVLSVLSEVPVVRNQDSAACTAYFADLIKGLPGYYNIFAATLEGNVYCSATPFKGEINVADRQWFQRSVQSGNFSFSRYQRSRISRRPVIAVGLPVMDGSGNLKAVVGAAINLSWLTEKIAALQLPPTATVFAIDREGTVLSRNLEPKLWMGKKMADSRLMNSILTQREGVIESDAIDGIKKIYAFVPVQGTDDGIFICYGISPKVAFADVAKKLMKELAWLGLLGVIASLAAWFGGDFLVLRRMKRLMKATNELSNGNLDARVEISGENDEIGQLENSFNQMAMALEQDVADRKRDLEKMSDLRLHNELLLTSAGEGIFGIDLSGNHTFVNPAAATMLGYEVDELIGMNSHSTIHHSRPDGNAYPEHACPIYSAYKNGLEHSAESDLFWRKDGSSFPVRYISTPIRKGNEITGAVVTFVDITESKRAEAELKKFNRALKTISKCNEALVHAVDEFTFLRTICEILVEEGGYRMAWIGYAEPDGDKRVLPLVHAGHEDGYLSNINVTWQDIELGRGPTGTAIRTRSYCVHNDIRTHPDFAPWREEALKRGYSSTIAFPLIADEQCFGVLTIYAPERDVFIDAEIPLLKDLADDMAFGILTIRMREEQSRSRDALRNSYEQLHSLAAHLHSVREEERASIAREVHDELGQILTALKFDLFSVAAKLKNINAPIHKTVSADVELIDRTIKAVKKICTELRPGILDHLGLGPAIEWQVAEFQKRSGIECQIVLSPEEATGDKNLGIALFRILQESLTNILRHSKATKVRVVLAENDRDIILEITDNGIGITEEELSKSNSFGLVGIHERVYPWKGQVRITGVRDKGTTIKITIPKNTGPGHK